MRKGIRRKRDCVWIEKRRDGWNVFLQTPEMEKPKIYPKEYVHQVAKDLRDDLKAQLRLDRSGFIGKDSQNISLKEAVEEYLANYGPKHPKSINQITYGLSKLFVHFKEERFVRTIILADRLDFETALFKAGHNKNGVISIMKCASGFFKFCMQKGYTKENPIAGVFKKLKEDKVGRHLTNDEIRVLIQHCYSRTRKDDDLRDMVEIDLHTGLRESELVNLRKSWFSLDLTSFIIPPEYAKGGKARAVPVPERIRPLIQKYMDKASDIFWPGWSAFRFRQAFHRGFKRSKITGRVRPHDLRHTYASRYLMDGGDAGSLQENLGHQSPITTKRYSHFEQRHMSKMADNMNYELDKPKLSLVV